MALAERPPTGSVKNPEPLAEYDAATDTFYVRFTREPLLALHLDDEIWALRDPEGETVKGFFIEDFERVFLKRHPDMLALWQDYRKPWRRHARRVQEAFASLLLAWFKGENRGIVLAPWFS